MGLENSCEIPRANSSKPRFNRVYNMQLHGAEQGGSKFQQTRQMYRNRVTRRIPRRQNLPAVSTSLIPRWWWLGR